MNKYEELLVKKGLYDNVEISEMDFSDLELLFSEYSIYKFKIDSFCINCNEMRTFERESKNEYKISESKKILSNTYQTKPSVQHSEVMIQQFMNKRYSLVFRCTREHNHIMLFDLFISGGRVYKIGQFPSYADVSIGNITKYKKILGKRFSEYSRSLGLFSHGIGIGSFVYIRRIIEGLLEDKYLEVKDDVTVTPDEFKKSEFKVKVRILKHCLPELLVENKNIYGILSKGIHELTEEECLKMYPFVKLEIELILDDLIDQKEKEIKAKEFKGFIQEQGNKPNGK